MLWYREERGDFFCTAAVQSLYCSTATVPHGIGGSNPDLGLPPPAPYHQAIGLSATLVGFQGSFFGMKSKSMMDTISMQESDLETKKASKMRNYRSLFSSTRNI